MAAVLLAAAVTTTACGSTDDSAGAGGSGRTTATLASLDPQPIAEHPASTLPVTVRSFDGVDVTITDTSRIVAADRYGTLTETVYALGLGDRLVGRDTAAKFPAVESVPNVTPSGASLSAEAVLALHPTVILTDTSIGPRSVQDQFRAAGIPVVYFDPTRTLAGVPTQIRAVADALGLPEQGRALSDRTATQIAAARAMAPTDGTPPKIAFLYMRGPAITMMAGPGSGADSLIEALGGVDAGTAAGLTEQFTPITSEALIAAAPDVFLMMTNGLESIGGLDGLAKIPGIAQTPAGKNRRVVDMADGALLSFGPRSGDVLGALATALYGPPPQ
ncbi:ABC transporter substrate-binding protein [Rhodococcus spelaei]|uniref:ABC transporter substrate-binding protein n=1 Tax=Rhodococcus spelaei TaxID=2546320 RepID=A0A541B859_9NOCA|nr:ABC transporter substrate-binding protein [Rhodococcus spelaei]TQF68483.1 ABC transporter substrate-binding protein [Rhodococcus spelaei]